MWEIFLNETKRFYNSVLSKVYDMSCITKQSPDNELQCVPPLHLQKLENMLQCRGMDNIAEYVQWLSTFSAVEKKDYLQPQ